MAAIHLTPTYISIFHWRGDSKYYGRVILTPLPSDFHCYWRGGSKYYGSDILNPPPISNSIRRDGSKYYPITIGEGVQNSMAAIY